MGGDEVLGSYVAAAPASGRTGGGGRRDAGLAGASILGFTRKGLPFFVVIDKPVYWLDNFTQA
jgi:hypothetical protein